MKNLYLKIRANEPLYRALRTFIQAFISAFAVSFLPFLQTQTVTKKILMSTLISSLSSAIAAVMNINKETITTEDVMLEDVEDVD